MKEVFTDYGGIDRGVIEDFSRAMKVVFPSAYVELLSQHNGLQFKENCFDFLDDNKVKQQACFGFCGYGGWPILEPIDKFQDHDIYGHEGVVVFGLRGNGDYVCFDYRRSKDPVVVLMRHDNYVPDGNGNMKMEVLKIADSFDEFIDMCYFSGD